MGQGHNINYYPKEPKCHSNIILLLTLQHYYCYYHSYYSQHSLQCWVLAFKEQTQEILLNACHLKEFLVFNRALYSFLPPSRPPSIHPIHLLPIPSPTEDMLRQLFHTLPKVSQRGWALNARRHSIAAELLGTRPILQGPKTVQNHTLPKFSTPCPRSSRGGGH